MCGDFRSRASTLKVSHLYETELEFYASHCLLLPVVCTRKPIPYAIAFAEKSARVPLSNPGDLEAPDAWQRLHMFPEDGIHPFDRELERSNPFLEIPVCDTFRPWDNDRILVDLPDRGSISPNTSSGIMLPGKFMLSELLRRRRYYERAPFLRELPESHKFQKLYRLPDNTKKIRTLRGMAVGYNSLTLYGFAEQAAYDDAFLDIPTGQLLPESTNNELTELLTQRARRALCVSGVTNHHFSTSSISLLG